MRYIVQILEAWANDSVGFHGRHRDIEYPQAHKRERGDRFDCLGTAKLSAGGASSHQQDEDGNQGLCTKQRDRESQTVRCSYRERREKVLKLA